MAVVYRHIGLDNNEVFYIGIGKSKDRAYHSYKRSKFWKFYVEKHGIEIQVLTEGLDYDTAKQVEVALIAHYGRRDKGLGTLVNMTDGGDGLQNFNHSDKSKFKMTLSHTGVKLQPHHLEARSKGQTGLKRTQETKDNIGLGNSKKSIDQYTLDGVFVKRYSSSAVASRETGIIGTNIRKVARGLRVHAGKFTWRWVSN